MEEKMSLDPKGRYLRQEKTGAIYVWSEILAKRHDMRSFNPVTMELETDLKPPAPVADKELIELQGKSFYVDPGLHEALKDIFAFIDELKARNSSLIALLEESTKPVSEIEKSKSKERKGK